MQIAECIQNPRKVKEVGFCMQIAECMQNLSKVKKGGWILYADSIQNPTFFLHFVQFRNKDNRRQL